MKKNLKGLVLLTAMVCLILIPGKIIAEEDGDETPQKRIIVPGGLKNVKLNQLWKVAKNKCFEMGYVVSNDDKETGNIFCTKSTKMGAYTIQINFDKVGFLVITKGVMDGAGFFQRLDPLPQQRKAEMEDALKKAAGIRN